MTIMLCRRTEKITRGLGNMLEANRYVEIAESKVVAPRFLLL